MWVCGCVCDAYDFHPENIDIIQYNNNFIFNIYLFRVEYHYYHTFRTESFLGIWNVYWHESFLGILKYALTFYIIFCAVSHQK